MGRTTYGQGASLVRIGRRSSVGRNSEHPSYNEFVFSEDHWDVSLEDSAETQKSRDRLNIRSSNLGL